MGKFKVGDRVVVEERAVHGSLEVGYRGKVTRVVGGTVQVDSKGTGNFYGSSGGKLRLDPLHPPHKHAELIKAWADGAEIEELSFNDVWNPRGQKSISWLPNSIYRIKPQKSDKDLQIEKLEKQAQQLAKDIAKLKES